MLAGVLSLDINWSPQELAKKLVRDACRHPFLDSRILLDDQRIACYAIEEESQKTYSSITVPLLNQESLIITGTVRSLAADTETCLKNISAKKDNTQRDLEILKLNGAWIAIIYNHQTGVFRLLSDQLGVAWLYIARFEHGYVFCSDFGALVKNFPGVLTIDEETSLVILGLGYAPDQRTCFKEIRVLPPGTAVELNNTDIAVTCQRPLMYGDHYVSLSSEEKYRHLDMIFEHAIATWYQSDTADLCVSLSGGYDSRYGLALLTKAGITPRCLTFGHPRSSDAKVAHLLCAELGLNHTIYSPTKTSWQTWQSAVEQAGVTGGFQWLGWTDEWLALLRNTGRQVVLGYLGDALSGKHLVPQPLTHQQWRKNWEQWSVDEGWADSPLLRPQAREKLRQCIRERFVDMSQNVVFAFPHQEAMHLDVFGRQRRFVAAQANLIARYLSPVLPFYTDLQLEFWANVRFEDLKEQTLYRSYAENRFPRLFKREKAGQRTLQRLRGVMTNLMINLIPSIRQVLSPPEINRVHIVKQNHSYFVALLHETFPIVEHFFYKSEIFAALSSFPKDSPLNFVQLSRLVNLLLLLRLGVYRSGESQESH